MKEIVSNVKAKSHFQIFTRKSEDGELVAKTGKCFNQITDLGYMSVYNIDGISTSVFPASQSTLNNFRYLKLSTSTVEVEPEDNSLGGIIYTLDGQGATTPDPVSCTRVVINNVAYVRYQVWYVFSLGALNNVTFSKLGVHSGTADTTLMFGQLIKDGQGDPTTVTVLGDEQLLVQYTSYWPAIENGTELGNFEEGGRTYQFLSVNVSSLNPNVSSLGYIVTFPMSISGTGAYINSSSNDESGSSGSCSVSVARTAFPNRVERMITLDMALLDQTTDIYSFSLRPRNNYIMGTYRLEVDPPLPKTDQNIVQLTFHWVLKWREE